jgi:hypothetical protein
MTDPADDAARKEALATARALEHEGATFASSSMRIAADRALDHFAARDALRPDGEADHVEVWGRRIGRALSLAAFIGLSVYLFLTYLY